MNQKHELVIFAASALLLNALAFFLALLVDFSQRPTKEQQGRITMSHTGKYSYSLIGNEILRCQPGTFLNKGGKCDVALGKQEVTATLKSVPSLFSEHYVATRIAAGGKVLWEQNDQQLHAAWMYASAIELNIVFLIVGCFLYSLRRSQSQKL